MKDIYNGDRYIYHTELEKLNKDDKLNAVWNNIIFIKNQLIEEKKIEREKEKQSKKKEKTRRIKIPLNYCYDYNEIKIDDNIAYINFYEAKINGHNYIIDMYKTTNNKFYIKIVDISDGNYKNVDFNEFKKKNAQPSLFDFFDI